MGFKSKCACRFSLETIGLPAFAWTFTLPSVVRVYEACGMWRALARDLVRTSGMWGIRVFEMHPGGHGMHVHAVTGERFCVREIRHLAEMHGWGRIHVKRITTETELVYAAKYLGKQLGAMDALKGRRRWASFGRWPEGKAPDRVKDIEVRCAFTRVIALIPQELRGTGRRAGLRLMRVAEGVLADMREFGVSYRLLEPVYPRHLLGVMWQSDWEPQCG